MNCNCQFFAQLKLLSIIINLALALVRWSSKIGALARLNSDSCPLWVPSLSVINSCRTVQPGWDEERGKSDFYSMTMFIKVGNEYKILSHEGGPFSLMEPFEM